MRRTDVLRLAEGKLRNARDLLIAADAPKALAKVRGALKSIGGAIRHAQENDYEVELHLD